MCVSMQQHLSLAPVIHSIFFWGVMKWSLQTLFDGEYPNCDHCKVPYVVGAEGFAKVGQKLVVLPDGSLLRGMLFCKKTDLG